MGRVGKVVWEDEAGIDPIVIVADLNDRLWGDSFWPQLNDTLGTIFDEYESDPIPPDLAPAAPEAVRAFAERYAKEDALAALFTDLAIALEAGAVRNATAWTLL